MFNVFLLLLNRGSFLGFSALVRFGLCAIINSIQVHRKIKEKKKESQTNTDNTIHFMSDNPKKFLIHFTQDLVDPTSVQCKRKALTSLLEFFSQHAWDTCSTLQHTANWKLLGESLTEVVSLIKEQNTQVTTPIFPPCSCFVNEAVSCQSFFGGYGTA